MNKTKNKKAFAFLFATIMFCGFISAQLESNAAAPVQLTVTSPSGKSGENVTVSIMISSDSGLGAASLYLKYDADKLEYRSYSNGPASGMSISNPDYRTEGSHKTIKFVLAASPGIIVGGPMYNIVFFIKSGWSGSTPLVLDVDEFYESAPPNKAIDKTISNGIVSIGATSTTTTVPATAPATTKPGASTTKPGSTSTIQGAETTVVSTTGEQSTAVPVTVPVEEIIEVLGPDAGNWNNDIGRLNEEQKEIIKEHFADQGKSVEITPDGVYYVETTAPDTTAAENTSANDNTGGSLLNSNTKKIIAVSVVGLILAVSFGVAYYFRKKKGTP